MYDFLQLHLRLLKPPPPASSSSTPKLRPKEERLYACEMQGPPHARLFKARVTIDGATFEGPEFCTTLKDEEHAVAKVAFMALSPDGTLEVRLLQELAQKKGTLLPVYATNRTGQPHTPQIEGPPHARLFKARVTIDGATFEGPEFCTTLKYEEHAIAKVAFMALSLDGILEDDCLYKSLLQELAQKKGTLLPVYATNRTGQPNTPQIED
ncbi:hypothetical protein L2E82_50181 [Cichorium intybus]|nr:hypothetical protein L2E82_50181 [Cichorium intybus]